MAKQNNKLYVFLLLAADLLSFYVALYLSYRLRLYVLDFEKFTDLMKWIYPNYTYVYFPFSHLVGFWWMPLVIVMLFAYEELYTSRFPFWEETKYMVKSLSIAILIIIAFIFVGNITSRTSALAIIFLWIISVFMFPLMRLWIKNLLFRFGIGVENLLIFGAGKAGVETAKGILKEHYLGYKIIGFLDDDEKKIGDKINIFAESYPVLDSIENFLKYLDTYNISIAVISMPSISHTDLTNITNMVQKHMKRMFVVPDIKGIALLNTRLFNLFNEQRFLLKIVNNLKFTVNKAVKRSFELVLTVIILPFLIPLITILGILIKLDSKGPVFFIQERLGAGNRNFKLVKFRTMHIDNDKILSDYLEKNPAQKKEWEKYKKLKGDDPRITGMGKFLRKTSLDELPQIINVLKGEMSLMGPRPYLPREKKEMGDFAEIILSIKPGITGLWQVSGRNDLEFEKRLELDAWYILNWSVWLDIMILFKTVKVVINREGAY